MFIGNNLSAHERDEFSKLKSQRDTALVIAPAMWLGFVLVTIWVFTSTVMGHKITGIIAALLLLFIGVIFTRDLVLITPDKIRERKRELKELSDKRETDPVAREKWLREDRQSRTDDGFRLL